MKTTLVSTPTSICRLGVSGRDITPSVGMYHRMWGAAKHDRSTGIHRPLRASAVVLEPHEAGQTGSRQVLVSLDHCLFRPPEMDEFRSHCCQLLGLDSQRLTIVFSHTHSSGLLTRERASMPGGDLIGPYLDALPQLIADTVQAAVSNLQPVTLTYGAADCRMGHHRDAFDEEAGIWVCGFHPDVEWPLPTKLVRATRDDGSLVATLVSYPCHPTTLAWENTLVSPDYVGALRETVEQATGVPCVFLLAPCGDIGPREGFVGDPNVADRNGRQVAFAALQALESLPPARHELQYLGPVISGATLGDWRYRPQTPQRLQAASVFEMRRFEVLLDYLPDLPTLDQARQQLTALMSEEAAATIRGDESESRRLRALVERSRRLIERLQPLPAGQYPYLVEIWRLGDVCWIAVDGEPYYALQSEIQQRFRNRTLIFMTLSNGAKACYLPTREAYEKSLYQVEVSMLAVGSLERVIEAICEQLQSLPATVSLSLAPNL